MTVQLKFKVISAYIEDLEEALNEWIEAERIEATDVLGAEMTVIRNIDQFSFATVIIRYIRHPDTDEGDWLTENLPQTAPPLIERPGAEYGAEV